MKDNFKLDCTLEINEETYMYLKDLQRYIFKDKNYSEIIEIITHEKWLKLKSKKDLKILKEVLENE